MRQPAVAGDGGGGLGPSAVWLASIGEDARLLTNEFLPELLLVSVVLLVSWGLRRGFRRNARTTL
jgi:predicted O-methyltransferase YrrM